jgi:hypothetical protein
MKKIIALALGVLAFAQFGKAQEAILPDANISSEIEFLSSGGSYGHWLQKQKETSASFQWRMSAKNLELFTSGYWEEFDSFSYRYHHNEFTDLEKTWEWQSGQWAEKSRTTKSYNQLLCIESVTELWDGWIWANDKRVTNIYNLQNLLSDQRTFIWNMGTWVPDLQDIKTYNNGVLANNTQKKWDGVIYINQISDSYLYNNGLMTQWLYQYWSNNSWKNSVRRNYIYNLNGKVASNTYQEWLGSWLNVNRYNYSYNSAALLSERITQDWFNASWVNSQRTVYTYNPQGQKTLEDIQTWDNGNWRNIYRSVYNYNASGQLEYQQIYLWVNNNWSLSARYIFTYDSNANLFSELYQLRSGGQWVNNRQWFYYYENYSPISTKKTEMIDLENFNITVYPNPASDYIYLNSDSPLGEDLTIEIINSLGIRVQSINIKELSLPFKINTENLGKGIYWIRFSSDDKSSFSAFQKY